MEQTYFQCVQKNIMPVTPVEPKQKKRRSRKRKAPMYPVEEPERSPEVLQPPANATHEIAAEDAPVNVLEWSSFAFIPGEFCAYSTPKPASRSEIEGALLCEEVPNIEEPRLEELSSRSTATADAQDLSPKDVIFVMLAYEEAGAEAIFKAGFEEARKHAIKWNIDSEDPVVAMVVHQSRACFDEFRLLFRINFAYEESSWTTSPSAYALFVL
ncbi:hypothetical protein L596_027704 [Steinernema carpocapsae]|nr:hypothetical protein L596_027704 [Steinernema carpocapsae]